MTIDSSRFVSRAFCHCKRTLQTLDFKIPTTVGEDLCVPIAAVH